MLVYQVLYPVPQQLKQATGVNGRRTLFKFLCADPAVG